MVAGVARRLEAAVGVSDRAGHRGFSGRGLKPPSEVKEARRLAFRSGSGCRGGNGNGPMVADAQDRAGGGQAREGLAEALVAYMHCVAQGSTTERLAGGSGETRAR